MELPYKPSALKITTTPRVYLAGAMSGTIVKEVVDWRKEEVDWRDDLIIKLAQYDIEGVSLATESLKSLSPNHQLGMNDDVSLELRRNAPHIHQPNNQQRPMPD